MGTGTQIHKIVYKGFISYSSKNNRAKEKGQTLHNVFGTENNRNQENLLIKIRKKNLTKL